MFRELKDCSGGVLTATTNRSIPSGPAETAARISRSLLWWIPLSVLVGFLVASRFLPQSWPLWQVVPLAVFLATPFGIGVYYGLRAVRLGGAKGWISVALHLVFMLTALIMPITEALS